jgi:hypothetical protein
MQTESQIPTEWSVVLELWDLPSPRSGSTRSPRSTRTPRSVVGSFKRRSRESALSFGPNARHHMRQNRISSRDWAAQYSSRKEKMIEQQNASTKANEENRNSADDAGNENSNQTRPEDPEVGRSRLETCLIMLSLCSALFLAALDTTIVTTAIPTIAEEFQAPLGYTWIGSSYLLAYCASVPSWGKFSEIWGRKPIILIAVAIFWIGSLLCGLSVNIGMLIAARALQGCGGGGIIVLVNICISDLFSLRSVGVYYGIVGMVWALAAAIGPIIGGAFTSQVSWRWCFYVNLPICGLAFAILVFVLKLHNPRTPLKEGLAAVDWLGSLLVVGGTLMLLFGRKWWYSPLLSSKPI